MKNIIIFILIAFVSIGRVSGQIKDLIDMAEEPVLAFLPIEDGDDNYGYMVLYELDEKQKEIFNYRYVILDNYLNNVANGEFELANYYGVNAPFSSVKKIDGKLLLEREHYRSDDPYTRQWYYIELDIERNTLGAPFYVENNTIKTGNLPWKAYKKAGKNHKMFASLKPLESGYIGFYRYKNSKDGRGIQKLTLFGSDRSVQWAADISANKNNVFNHYLEYIDEDIIILREWSKNEMNFTGYNTATGDVVFHFNYENKNSTYSHSYGIKVERVNDNLHFVGKICEYRKSGYKLDQSVGLFRKVFDIKGNAISDDLILWTDLAEDAIIDHDGEVQDGYPLRIQQFYVFNDERVTAVAERVRKKSMGIRALSDFYIVELSADFKLKHIEKIEKLEKTVLYRQGTNDFLFSQKTADGNGCVILYETYEEETANEKSQSIVGIVKMIDGKISQDVLRKNSEDYYLTAHPAARGYVLLREFDFEEKVNTIRLEKINF